MHGHVCILKKRVDPVLGVMRWSLPKKEICLCQGVVTPVVMNICPTMETDYADDELLFFDDPRELTMRHNWKKNELDKLLERVEYCGNRL